MLKEKLRRATWQRSSLQADANNIILFFTLPLELTKGNIGPTDHCGVQLSTGMNIDSLRGPPIGFRTANWHGHCNRSHPPCRVGVLG
jgi:hypothetical protein